LAHSGKHFAVFFTEVGENLHLQAAAKFISALGGDLNQNL
jgi:hypothetical protein